MKLEWADYAAGDSSGNTRSQLSQLAEPLWTDPAVKSGIHVRQLTSTKKKKETKAQAGNELSNIYSPKVLACEGKATTTIHHATTSTTFAPVATT